MGLQRCWLTLRYEWFVELSHQTILQSVFARGIKLLELCRDVTVLKMGAAPLAIRSSGPSLRYTWSLIFEAAVLVLRVRC